MSETPKHTPGPWYASGSYIEKTPSGHRFTIAEVFRHNVGQCKANARLIAAAPDLLAACELALTLLEDLTTEEFSRGGDRPARVALQAALARAGDTGHATP